MVSHRAKGRLAYSVQRAAYRGMDDLRLKKRWEIGVAGEILADIIDGTFRHFNKLRTGLRLKKNHSLKRAKEQAENYPLSILSIIIRSL